MYKVLREIGNMSGHFGVKIVELEELGMVAISSERSNGYDMEAWKCDEFGYALNGAEPSFYLEPVFEPDSDEEDPQYECIGYELA